MAVVEEKKKRKRFSWMKFLSHKKTKEQKNEESDSEPSEGVEPIAFTPTIKHHTLDSANDALCPVENSNNPSIQNGNGVENSISGQNVRSNLYPSLEDASSENERMEHSDVSDKRHQEANISNSPQDTGEITEIDDNMRNEHIEEILLESHRENSAAELYSENNTERPACGAHVERERVDSHVIPQDLDGGALQVYTHVFVLGLLCAYSLPLAALYAAALAGYFKPTSLGLQRAGTRLLKSIENIGVSWHVVIWVLLASFGNVYLALAYAAILLLYKLILAVAEQIAIAIAQLVASLIYVLFLGPVIALFGAIFSAARPLPGQPQGQVQNAKASNIIEALLKFFLFPFHLPVMIMQFQQRQQHAAAREHPGRSCEILRRLFHSRPSPRRSIQPYHGNASQSTWQRRDKPSRGCNICQRLFGGRGNSPAVSIPRRGNNQLPSLGKFPSLPLPRSGNFHSTAFGPGVFISRPRPSRGCDICKRLLR